MLRPEQSDLWIYTTLRATGDGRPFQATHLFLTSLRTSPKALLRLERERWSLESWHWSRDTQLHEALHRYRGNGAGLQPLAGNGVIRGVVCLNRIQRSYKRSEMSSNRLKSAQI